MLVLLQNTRVTYLIRTRRPVLKAYDKQTGAATALFEAR
jgi:hypothetical protein